MTTSRLTRPAAPRKTTASTEPARPGAAPAERRNFDEALRRVGGREKASPDGSPEKADPKRPSPAPKRGKALSPRRGSEAVETSSPESGVEAAKDSGVAQGTSKPVRRKAGTAAGDRSRASRAMGDAANPQSALASSAMSGNAHAAATPSTPAIDGTATSEVRATDTLPDRLSVTQTLRQLAERIARTAAVRTGPGETLSLRVDFGRRLGGARVEVKRTAGGELEIRLQTDNARGGEAVNRHLDSLREGLASRGLDVGSIQVLSTPAAEAATPRPSTPPGAAAGGEERPRRDPDSHDREHRQAWTEPDTENEEDTP